MGRTPSNRWGLSWHVQVFILCLVYMGASAADKLSAQAWAAEPQVIYALQSISTDDEVVQTSLVAARPVGGLRIAHVTELLKFADEAVAQKLAGCPNKGLVMARLLIALEPDPDEMMPILPKFVTEYTKKIAQSARRASDRHSKDVAAAHGRLRVARRRDTPAAEARELEALQELEGELAPRFTAGAAPGGGAPPPPPPPPQQPAVPVSASLLAFAMGAHARLGEASCVRLLDEDSLRAIAAHVRGAQRRRRQPSVIEQQARLAPLYHRRWLKEKAAREESERRLAQAGLELGRAARQDAACAAAASNGREVAQLRAHLAEVVEGAALAWQRVTKLEDQRDVHRSQRVGGLLETMQHKNDQIKKLSARRTLNQRRIGDANLDQRRVQVAQQQAKEAQAYLNEYCVSDRARDDSLDASERAARALKEQNEALREQLAAAGAQLAAAEAARDRYKAIAVPPTEKFFRKGHYTDAVDLTSLQVIANLGVSANVVSQLFVIFGDFFSVTIPSHEQKVLSGTDADGKREYKTRSLLYVPGKTHMKELPAIGGELHKIQVGSWLLEDADANFCYIADGANSQQREILAQILSRRDKATGKLESRALSIDEISSKSSEGQQAKLRSALKAASEAWAEADALGLLRDVHEEAEAACGEEAADEEVADAATFHAQRRKALRAKLRAKIAELRPASAMNDRAAPARKAARYARGGDGSGGDGDVVNDPTCAHHAVANIGEEGRKAIDGVLRAKMNITEEQAEGDAAKVKALRTSVGWFSSPACSLIYQVSKYVALFSSKGYAIGENFAQWLAQKMSTTERLAGELIAHVEDLLAICGGRDYVFFLDSAVVERFSQLESLYGYLLEEADMGAEAGGKLRKAILTGFESVYCMSAVRSMAVISDAWLWPMLRAIEPGDDVHILDVCPVLWPRVVAWLEEAAANPQSAIDDSLSLRASLEAAGLRTTPRREPSAAQRRRAVRAQADMQRIRAAIGADAELKALVHQMLTAAFTAMAAGVRNHASEFMPGGCCCSANVTPALRARLDGMPLTSVAAEAMFARVKRRAERGGIARHDTRMGGVLCERDGTVEWARQQKDADGLLRLAAKRWRSGSGKHTMEAERRLKGEEKAPEREAKLQKKRAGRVEKAAALERLKAVELVTKYSALTTMGNEQLSEQLKVYKKLEKKTGFKTTGSGREMRLLLQSLLCEKFGAAANDLADGDSGVEGRGVRRRKVEGGGKGGGKGKGKGKGSKRKKANVVSLHGWEWDADEEFDIDSLIGKMVADGTDVPGREGEAIEAGTVLYKVLWEGFPPECATWEMEDDIPCGEVDFVEQYEAALAQEEEDDGDDGP